MLCALAKETSKEKGSSVVSSQCVRRESMGSVCEGVIGNNTYTASHQPARPHVDASSNEISESVKRKESPFTCYTIRVSTLSRIIDI